MHDGERRWWECPRPSGSPRAGGRVSALDGDAPPDAPPDARPLGLPPLTRGAPAAAERESHDAHAPLAAVGLAAGVALAPVSTPAQAAQHNGTHLHARMSSTSAYPHCYGGAWYDSGHGWRELEINLHGIGGLNGETITVLVHGARVGRARVHHGDAHLDRHRGLPTMRAGSWVKVRTGSGTLVGSGQLHRMRHHHGMM